MTAPNKVTLTHPVTIGGREISEIVFERPKAKRMALLARIEALRPAAPEGQEAPPMSKEAEVEVSYLMVQVVTGWADDEVDEIDLIDDFPRVVEAAADFLEGIGGRAAPTGAA